MNEWMDFLPLGWQWEVVGREEAGGVTCVCVCEINNGINNPRIPLLFHNKRDKPRKLLIYRIEILFLPSLSAVSFCNFFFHTPTHTRTRNIIKVRFEYEQTIPTHTHTHTLRRTHSRYSFIIFVSFLLRSLRRFQSCCRLFLINLVVEGLGVVRGGWLNRLFFLLLFKNDILAMKWRAIWSLHFYFFIFFFELLIYADWCCCGCGLVSDEELGRWRRSGSVHLNLGRVPFEDKSFDEGQFVVQVLEAAPGVQVLDVAQVLLVLAHDLFFDAL